MSGGFRKQIGLIKGRLGTYINEAKLLKLKPDQGLSLEAHIEQLTDLTSVIKHHITRMKKTVGLLEEQNDKWLNFMTQLPPDEREAEYSRYEDTTTRADNFFEIMESAREAIDVLESKYDENQIQLGIRSRSQANTDLNPSLPQPQTFVNLPTFKLKEFDGDVLHYTEFWESFSSSIHNHPKLANVDKFNYLLSFLTGNAREAIAGYAVTDANYPIVVEVLKRRFGNQDIIKHSLHTELRNLPMSSDKVVDLRHTLESVERICRQLETLGVDLDQALTTMTIEEKFPKGVLLKLYEEKSAAASWNTKTLRQRLEKLVGLREEVGRIHNENIHRTPQEKHSLRGKPPFNRNQREKHDNTFNTFAVVSPSRGSANPRGRGRGMHRGPTTNIPNQFSPCYLCGGSHLNANCTNYKDIETRKRRLRELQRCFACLGFGHEASQCERPAWCLQCDAQHHQVLCPRNVVEALSNNAPSVQTQRPTPITGNNRGRSSARGRTPMHRNTSGVHAVLHNEEEAHDGVSEEQDEDQVYATIDLSQSEPAVDVLLMTAKVVIFNTDQPSRQEETTVFFDGGSQKSYISSELVSRLKLYPISTEQLLISTFNGQRPKKVLSSTSKIAVQLENGQRKNLLVHSIDNITKAIKAIHIHKKEFASMRNDRVLNLIDRTHSVQPGLLIGIDYLFEFFTFSGSTVLPSGFRVLESAVGPVLCGPGQLLLNQEETISTSVITEKTIENFWSLEQIGINDCPIKNDEDEALEHFAKTVTNVEGRYIVRLPYKTDNPKLDSNFGQCVGRLKSLQTRLREHPELLKAYDKNISDLLQASTIEVAPRTPTGKVHYLPHHGVITPDKTTTKLRMVIDGSAKSKTFLKSLNEQLLKGPLLLSDLVGMLIRFRCCPIAIISDIEKAFLNIGLDEQDRDATRFLYWIDPNLPISNDNLVTYRYCRLPFGLICSPFILAAVIIHHLRQYTLPIAEEIRNNIYVDNVILSAKTTSEAIEKYQISKSIFADAKMNLREFVSSDTEFMEFVKKQEGKEVPETVKVLGTKWDPRQDYLEISLVTSKEEKTLTKRVVLHVIASVFDPLGLLAPAIVVAKRFFQKLWIKQYGWDDELSVIEAQEWKTIIEDWNQGDFTFDRKLFVTSSQEVENELHTFVDASAHAYAAAVYLKVIEANGKVQTSLVITKNRLCPTKKITIPRLELMAILIGVRLTDFVNKEINLKISKFFIWSDSQCCLYWIVSNKEQSRFVKNRLDEIRKHRQFQFCYVPTNENPADLSSRGISVSELKLNELWWKGPPWLLNSAQYWPPQPDLKPMKLTELESDTITTVAIEESEPIVPFIDIQRFSSWSKLLITVAIILRFIKSRIVRLFPTAHNFLADVTVSGVLTAPDYAIAERIIFRLAQQMLPPSVEERKHLGLFQDPTNIWRCGGRLEESALPNASIHPIFLPRKSWITTLRILHEHVKNCHGGVQHTLAQMRLAFWIPKGRITVKRAIRQNCLPCRKFLTIPFMLPTMPQLPQTRVQRSIPFNHTGLDYLGPVLIRQNAERMKVWICLFTCFTTRAIHLEVVADMTAVSFLHALRRFFARRGRPSNIVSDNAPQFQLTSKTIQTAWNSIVADTAVLNYTAQDGIRWHFITEYSPWKGGFYERLVALVKNSFKKSVGRNCLQRQEFITLICEIEAVINSRPLTHLYDDSQSFEVLRPIDFLHIDCNPGIPSTEEDDTDQEYRPPTIESHEKLLAAFNNSMKHLNKFWHYWTAEYLQSLRERYQIQHTGPKSKCRFLPEVGELVIVSQDDAPRGTWKLGRIIALPRSADNAIRSATVQMPNRKILNRPISRLYPLEIDKIKPTPQIDTVTASTTVKEDRIVGQTSSSQARTPLFFFATVLILTMCSSTNANMCHLNTTLIRIHTQTCSRQGMMVMRKEDGNLCWILLQCDNRHIQPLLSVEKLILFDSISSLSSRYCGPKCICPNWAAACSHYHGPSEKTSTIKDETTRVILESERPSVCGFQRSELCSERKIASFAQVQLFDNSTHLVKSLQLVQTQVIAEEYTCVGEGIQVGSPKFCENHECAANGKKLCYYAKNDIIQLATESGMVIIFAWGSVSKDFYEQPHQVAVPYCNSCQIRCTQGGVELNSKDSLDHAEICVRNYCHHISSPQSTEKILFPLEVSLFNHEVKTRLWKNGQLITHFSTICPSNPLCDLIDCIFCIKYLANFQCAPKGVLIVALIVVYLMLTVIFCLLKPCFAISKCLKRCILGVGRCLCSGVRHSIWLLYRKCRKRSRPRTSSNEEKDDLLVDRSRKRFHFRPRQSSVWSAVILITFSLIRTSESCTETAMLTASQEVCEISKTGTTCKFSATTLLSILPGGQDTCLILRNNQQHAVGTLTLNVQQIKSVCKSKTEFFSREYDIHIESSKRCLHAGSCWVHACTNTSISDKLKEFSDQANKAPGYTYCVESCGCFGCGCFVCSSACLFYRIFALPKNPIIYKIFSCPIWETQVQIKARLQLNNESTSHEFIITPGKSQAWNQIKIVGSSISLPQMPILGSQFIFGGNRTAIVRPSTEGIMSGIATSYMQCASYRKAYEFDCQFPPEICQCQPAEVRVNCQCSQASLENFLGQTERLLPLSATGIFISCNNTQIEAQYESVASIQVQVTLDGLTASIGYDSSRCRLRTLSNVTGCYQCITGAKLEFECFTDYGQAFAQISCGKQSFSTICNSTGVRSTATLSFVHSLVHENCSISCPAGDSSFEIQGQLFFVEDSILRKSTNMQVSERLPIGEQLLLNLAILHDILNNNWLDTAIMIVMLIVVIIATGFLLPHLRCLFDIVQCVLSNKRTTSATRKNV